MESIVGTIRKEDPLSIILKLVGETCNLDCSYCYEKRKPYAGARVLDPEFVAQMLAKMQRSHPIAIELHGGEPLLYSKENFHRLSEIFATYRSSIERLTIQTNATLLTADWVDFLRGCFPTLQIGISDDAMPGTDAYRVDYAGISAASAIRETLEMLSERGIFVGCICVVTDKSLLMAHDIIKYFSDLSCIKVLKFVPCFDYSVSQGEGPKRRGEILDLITTSSAPKLPWAISPAQYTKFLCDIWNVWLDGGSYDQFLIEPFISVLRKASGGSTNNCHFEETKCAHVFTLYPDGQLGGCDELDKNFSLYGEIQSQIPIVEANTRWCSNLDEQTKLLNAQCEGCSHRSRCGGGCIAIRRRLQVANLDLEYCTHRKTLIDFIEREWNVILSHERENHTAT